uniref:Uncharacterized protein n=1 Tax=Arion vulgaris TaxID=1028688 RepID=A0A0B7BXH2_9EUPU
MEEPERAMERQNILGSQGSGQGKMTTSEPRVCIENRCLGRSMIAYASLHGT